MFPSFHCVCVFSDYVGCHKFGLINPSSSWQYVNGQNKYEHLKYFVKKIND